MQERRVLSVSMAPWPSLCYFAALLGRSREHSERRQGTRNTVSPFAKMNKYCLKAPGRRPWEG